MNLGRTLLFSPGDHERRVERALTSPAATVVLDLEDGAADGAAKEAGRATIARALPAARRRGVFVRINATGTADQAADLTALAPVLDRVDGIVLPKAETRGEVDDLPGDLPVLPVVETPAGLLAAAEIATSPRAVGLILGVLDLAAELGVDPVTGLDHARAHLTVAARAAGLPGPVDGPYPDLDDEDGLARSSRRSRAAGYSGRVVLHPRQIPVVERAYAPTQVEIAHARQIVAAAGKGSGSLRLPNGTFVDKPVITRAQALLAEAGEGHASA
ncbi:CoA ester lyase [Streptomyces javensis]|uniref:HpcH/HpaI aldolase/citrate lyase family protein n=1 Tax=Streptomyces javensis TaxID=114698 RepID=UPI0033DAD487